MAVTQAMIDALDAALAKGVLEIRDGEKTLKYHSADEMLAKRNALANILASQTTPSRTLPRHQLADFRDD